eukprot:m.347212 g.347212  ORF g.347212 m.347212 type:complete len:326 (+) comp31794_c0_seq1:89-1066(+)
MRRALTFVFFSVAVTNAQKSAKGGGPMGGGGGGTPAVDPTHGCPMLNDVGTTTVYGRDERTDNNFSPGENIFGPFEAGFTSQQDNILSALGCSDPSKGYLAGGIDTYTAEQMVAAGCGVTLPRIEGNKYVSLLDECGGHTEDYHFHERLECLYDKTASGHSTKIGESNGGQDLFGMYEDTNQLPLLDACGGHYGVTPESNGEIVYHYHVQDKPPFTFGCYGPNDDGSLVTVSQCRDFYDGCDGDLVTVETPDGKIDYDLWCPCYDANGANSGEPVELPVFESFGANGNVTFGAPQQTTSTIDSDGATIITAGSNLLLCLAFAFLI